MDAEHAALLAEIARCGSFAEVARDRAVDPSWVSRTVAAIEAELGFRIFQRSTRRVALTEAGDAYLRDALPAIEALERARDDALSLARGPLGTLRLTTTVAFGQKVIVPMLPAFRRAFPSVKVDLVLSDGNLDLIAERIDLAVRLGPEVFGDLVAARLHDTRYRVCASPDYIARHGRPARPAELSQRDCLRFALPGFRSHWLFRDDRGDIEKVAVDGSLTASGALALHALAVAGMGPALLANWLVDDDLAQGRLVDLFPDLRVAATSFETAIWVLYPSRSFLPEKVRAMVDFLRGEATTRWRRWP